MKKVEESDSTSPDFAGLTAKQTKALPLLASGITATDISKQLKISQQQISIWQRDDKFLNALNTVRRDAMRDAETALSGLAMDAVHALQDSLNNASSDQTRLRAAMYIIDHLGFSVNMDAMGAEPSGTVNMKLLLTSLGTQP